MDVSDTAATRTTGQSGAVKTWRPEAARQAMDTTLGTQFPVRDIQPEA